MDKRTFKNEVYGELAKITKALANPHRMEIIDLLAQGPFSVEGIAHYTNMSIANASQHLQVLKNARLVNTVRKGNYILYSLSHEKVFKTWQGLRGLGIFSNNVVGKLIHDYRQNHHVLEAVKLEELQEKLTSNQIILLDVRPEEEYRKGHIHQAISMPIDQLSQKLEYLSKEKEIIAYCRGPLCVYADEAVELLRNNGFKANRLEEGFPDWASLGLPIETMQVK